MRSVTVRSFHSPDSKSKEWTFSPTLISPIGRRPVSVETSVSRAKHFVRRKSTTSSTFLSAPNPFGAFPASGRRWLRHLECFLYCDLLLSDDPCQFRPRDSRQDTCSNSAGIYPPPAGWVSQWRLILQDSLIKL